MSKVANLSPGTKLSETLAVLSGDVNTPFASQNSSYDPYSNGPYSHRVYGPVNVIDKTYKKRQRIRFLSKDISQFSLQFKNLLEI